MARNKITLLIAAVLFSTAGRAQESNTTRERVLSQEIINSLPTPQNVQSLFAATYVLSKTQTLEGELVRVILHAPSSFVYIDVKDANGVTEESSSGQESTSSSPGARPAPRRTIVCSWRCRCTDGDTRSDDAFAELLEVLQKRHPALARFTCGVFVRIGLIGDGKGCGHGAIL